MVFLLLLLLLRFDMQRIQNRCSISLRKYAWSQCLHASHFSNNEAFDDSGFRGMYWTARLVGSKNGAIEP